MRRIAATVGAAVLVVAALSLVADATIPAAGSQTPLALYVDPRIGSDDAGGRIPQEPLESVTEALRRAEPGTKILIVGYGYTLVHQGTGQRCVTVRGTARRPVVIRRDLYTNSDRAAILTTRAAVQGRWRLVDQQRGFRTWVTRWDHHVRLTKFPSHGLVQVGEVGLDAYAAEPPLAVGNATWWERSGGQTEHGGRGGHDQHGRLYVRMDGANPNEYHVVIKDGDAICLSGHSAHVRIQGLAVNGAVHAVRVEPGARDIEISDIARHDVLDEDVVPPGTSGGRGR